MASENFSNQISNFFRALTSRQRILLVVSVVVVVGTLWVFVWLFGNADYKTLYTDLPPGEASRITRRLDERRIPYQVSQDGSTVSVPTGKIDQARLDLAMALYGQGRNEDAIEELLDLFRRAPKWNDDAARKQLLKIFEALGAADPVVVSGRRKLSSVLFS